ncbi:MAG: iron-containing alcohol dehydrogenase, partial [Olsenella sp.]|nr:iron-containing alcohol dehydrogenase [Olsenella sp.]
VAVVDPDMMASMPVGLTAATGMDALTHAIEGYTTKGAWELSDMFHLEAIRIISHNLREAVAEAKSKEPGEGRKEMALGQYIAGMGFSNVGLGIVHSMAHTLSAHYDTPHGVACAMLLPVCMEYNADACGERYRQIGRVMDVAGWDTDPIDVVNKNVVAAVAKLGEDVGIPKTCKGLVEADLDQLADDAAADACFPGTPKPADHETIKALFRKVME